MSKQQKTILITGATSGIGRHAALHLAGRNHRVIATGRRKAALEKLREEARGGIDVLPLDVTDAGSIETAKARVNDLTEGYGIDVLVNNAGFGTAGPLIEMPDADIRAQFDTNVFGLVAVSQAFVPAMMTRRSGRVINVSSIGGKFTFPFFGAYNATKYAVESMSDALRVELAPFGVHVSLIEPGVIRTNFADTAMSEVSSYSTESSAYLSVLGRAEELREMSEKQAVGPECISRAIEQAVSARRPRARYMAPLRAKLMIAVARIMPTRWTDALIARFAFLTERQLRKTHSGEPPRSQVDANL